MYKRLQLKTFIQVNTTLTDGANIKEKENFYIETKKIFTYAYTRSNNSKRYIETEKYLLNNIEKMFNEKKNNKQKTQFNNDDMEY